MSELPLPKIKLWCMEDFDEEPDYTGEEFNSTVYAEDNAEYLDELEEEEEEELED